MGKLFGTSGIRGVAGSEINDELVERLSLAFAATIGAGKRVCVGRDTRASGPDLEEKLVGELTENGLSVTRLGVISTPGVYYLTRELGFDAGVMITASHNPPEYNGFKFCNSEGMSLDQEKMEGYYFEPPAHSTKQKGKSVRMEGASEFFKRMLVLCPKPLKRLRLVLDCACGPNSTHAPGFFRGMGHEVLEVNCEPDVTKCNRPLEPKGDTLEKTIAFAIESKADAGVCFDGDNDRVVFLNAKGFVGLQDANAAVALSAFNEKKEAVGSVETGRFVENAIKRAGGSLHRTIVGDAFIARCVKERGAALGLEECGHYMLPEVGYFSSTIYPACLLLSKFDLNSLDKEFEGVERPLFAKERINCPNEEKERVMTAVAGKMQALGGRVTSIDGVRVDWENAWVLVRPSGTEPYMKVSAEASSKEKLEELVSKGIKLIGDAL